jgi:hypothetical protein
MDYFQPVNRPLHLTKTKAAARQVYLSIQALAAGDYDAAITLAGAAECMIEGDPDIEVTTALFADPRGADIPAPYTWNEIANLERNWLKHRTETEKMPTEITLDLDNTRFTSFGLSVSCRSTTLLPRWWRSRNGIGRTCC